MLEHTIQALVGSLIGEHQRITHIITAELAFKNLRALAVSLYKERHGEDADYLDLRELMKRAAQAEEERNQVTHSIWGAGTLGGRITRIKTTAKEKRGLHYQFHDIGGAELAAIAEKLSRLSGDIQGFWLKLVASGKAANHLGVKS